jgi:hypothetical protein
MLARLELCAHSGRDEPVDQLTRGRFTGWRPFCAGDVSHAHALRVHGDLNREAEHALAGRIFDADGRDLANGDTVELDRRAQRQSAQRILEVDHERAALGIGRAHRPFAIGKKGERGIDRRGRAGGKVRRRLKRESALDQRGERLGLQAQPIGIERQIDARGVPETRALGHIPIVGAVDEDLERHRLAVGVELIGDHLSDRDAPEAHRCTDIERADLRGMQDEFASGQIGRHDRRDVQTREVALRLLRLAHVEPDIRS